MSAAWLLALQAVLGAGDTLWFHEWRGRLPARPAARAELALHAPRALIYGVLFCSLPWIAWRGPGGVLLAVLVVAEAVITFADFVVEDRVRPGLGLVFAGERVMHGLMAVVYGAFLAGFLPLLLRWIQGGGGILAADDPRALRVGLTLLGVGCLASGIRDGLAALGIRAAAWPWPPIESADGRPQPVSAPVSPIPTGWAVAGVVALGLAARRAHR